jgi:hypothetical protein
MLVEEVEFGGSGTPARYPGFSVCIEKKDGQRYRRSYALLGNVVRFAGERPCEPAASPAIAAPAAQIAAAPEPMPPKSEGLGQRVKSRVSGWLGLK